MPSALSEKSRGVQRSDMTYSRSAIARRILTMAIILSVIGCAAQSPEPDNSPMNRADTTNSTSEQSLSVTPENSSKLSDLFATVTDVEVTTQGTNNYAFAVTIESPDTGCEQYANWWEVVTEDGDLIYRRILAHSHIDEQPFRRTGGPVNLQPEQTVIVRAHMDPDGYGSQAMQGSASIGFTKVMLPEGFAADLAEAEPQPTGCAF